MKRIVISILITVGIILLLLLQISLKDLFHLFTTLDLFWAALGSIAYLLAILLRALRFKWLLYSKVIPFSDLFRITAFYHLSLMILPSKLGELSLPYFLNKISGMNATERRKQSPQGSEFTSLFSSSAPLSVSSAGSFLEYKKNPSPTVL